MTREGGGRARDVSERGEKRDREGVVQRKRGQRITFGSCSKPERIQVFAELFKCEVEVIEAVMVAIRIMVHGEKEEERKCIRKKNKRLATPSYPTNWR